MTWNLSSTESVYNIFEETGLLASLIPCEPIRGDGRLPDRTFINFGQARKKLLHARSIYFGDKINVMSSVTLANESGFQQICPGARVVLFLNRPPSFSRLNYSEATVSIHIHSACLKFKMSRTHFYHWKSQRNSLNVLQKELEQIQVGFTFTYCFFKGEHFETKEYWIYF